MINRPGRFHYHFRFDYPTADEIEVYLRDKIDEKYYPEIKEVVNFSYKVKLNYDCLRAIAFELNSGEKFSEAINIIASPCISKKELFLQKNLWCLISFPLQRATSLS